jgi:hypothetical protein
VAAEDSPLPTAIQDGLDRFSERIQQALGEHLISVVLYGTSARGEPARDGLQVEVMVVVDDVSIEMLDAAALPVQLGRQEFRLAVFFLSEDELHRSTDVFPIKFLQMQRHHRVVSGRDVLSGLQISRRHLRLRCEQEIKNLMLRLHRFYLDQHSLPEQLEMTLIRTVSAFVESLGILVELKTGALPPGVDAVVAAAADVGLDVEPLKDGLSLMRGTLQPETDELMRLYGAFMKAVHQAAVIVDEL